MSFALFFIPDIIGTMKFAEHLQAHLTPEWRTQYIKYDDLKEFLYKCANEISEELDEETRQAYFISKDEEFYNVCNDELIKINDFFEEKVAEAKRRLKDLEQELAEYKQFKQQLATQKLQANGVDAVLPGAMIRRYRDMKKHRGRVRKLQEIKLAFQEFYLNLILLQNYQALNFTGFRKILKKHDKIFGLSSGYQWRVRNVESARFNVSKDVAEFIDRVEQVYIGDLERGDRHTAMKRLRVPPLTEREKPGTTFLVGFLFGIFSMQSLSVTLAIVYLGPGIEPWQPGLRLFRASLLVPLFICLLGVNTYGWRGAGVNHVLIFEIDPRHHLNHMEILKAGGILAVTWCAALQLFVFSGWLTGMPPFAAPFLYWAFMPIYLLNPLPVCQHKSRRWLCRI
uniref:SPX domain-containing protein n=1 Tax=Macrostomum lignano TaxID=282301 RepID=A0A1I8IBI9_9PLAT